MKYLKVLFWPIMFMVGQIFIQYVFTFIFNNKYYPNVDLEIINTQEYQVKLNDFIYNHTLIILLITSLIFIPLFYVIYRNYKVKSNKFNILKYLLIAVIFAFIYNLYLSIITDYNVSTLPIYIQILASGIIGPILEELLYRGIIYNKLKEFKSIKTSMIISTLIFSSMHFSIIDSIYTLFIGYLLVYVYEKSKNLKYSMIIHICINTSVIVLGLFINLNIIFNIILLFVALILEIILFKGELYE